MENSRDFTPRKALHGVRHNLHGSGRRDRCPAHLIAGVSALIGMICCAPAVVRGQAAQFSPTDMPAGRALPSLEVRLSRNLYLIQIDAKTGAPVMPKDVIASGSLVGWPSDLPRPSTFTWHVFLDWDAKPYPTRHSIDDLKFEHPSPFPVSLDAQVRGGRLKVLARTTFEGREVIGQAIAEIQGVNPPRSAVLRAFPPNRIGLIASKIAMAESGMQQFNAADGMPVMSRSNDVGMMQLNAPTGAITSADQIWDWRANLKRGLEMMADKRRKTILASRGGVDRQPDRRDIAAGYEDAACLNFLRWYIGLRVVAPPFVPQLSSQPGSGILPGETDPDRLALSQVERDAIRRYNGGREYGLALITDPDTLSIQGVEWRVDPARGGVRARSGDPDYVGHVLRARSGFIIPAPLKPAKIKHRRLRRRFSKHGRNR